MAFDWTSTDSIFASGTPDAPKIDYTSSGGLFSGFDTSNLIEGGSNVGWMQLAGAFLGAGGGSAAPSPSNTSQYLNFDSSGWTVATSGSKANGASGGIPWYVWVIAGVVAVRALKAKA